MVGVPEITPVELLSVNPGGSEPDEIEYVNGAVPPVSESVAEYPVPTVPLPLPLPHDPHPRLIGEPTTTMVQTWVSVLPFESTTLPVNVYVPVVVGVPLIVPVELLSVSPGGSDPETIEYVIVPIPPAIE